MQMPFRVVVDGGELPTVRIDATLPEVSVIERVPGRRWRRHRRKRAWLAHAEEQDGLSSVEHEQAREHLAVESAQRHRRMRASDLGDAVDEIVDADRDLGPREFDEREKRVPDGRVQPWLGQSVSLMAATIMPARAAATPLRAASFVMKRVKKDEDGTGLDM
jgi:hypothetical protein